MNYAKGLATRKEIIRAAIALFGEVGYYAASLREIATRAGISHPGLLHHFPNKTALLEAVLEHRDELDLRDDEEARSRGSDRFTEFVRLARVNSRRKAVVELFAGLSAEATPSDHPAHTYFKGRYESGIKAVADELRDRAERGGLAPGVDPDTAARAITALMDGLQVQWLYSLDGPPDEEVDMAADLLAYLRLILVDPPTDPCGPRHRDDLDQAAGTRGHPVASPIEKAQ